MLRTMLRMLRALLRMLRTMLRLLIGSVAIVSLAACSGGGASQADIEAKIAAQIVEDGLSENDAACFAGVLVDEVGLDAIKDIDFSAEEPPEELEDEIVAASTKAIVTCKIDVADLAS